MKESEMAKPKHRGVKSKSPSHFGVARKKEFRCFHLTAYNQATRLSRKMSDENSSIGCLNVKLNAIAAAVERRLQ
jgi:hypothetical protein